jgi:hypothetical protein
MHAVKAYKGRTGIAPLILNISTRWMQAEGRTSRLLYARGKQSRYAVHQRLAGAQQPCRSNPGSCTATLLKETDICNEVLSVQGEGRL